MSSMSSSGSSQSVNDNRRDGFVYKLIDIKLDKIIYIGSSFDTPNGRFSDHKSLSKSKPNRKIYKYISDNNGWDNIKMKIIKKYQNFTKDELVNKEQHYYKQCDDLLNTLNPCRDKKQYYADNKIAMLESCKVYYDANKDTILAKNKQYRDANKDKISAHHKQYYKDNADKRKEYIEKNKDKIKQTELKYREENKDEINKRRQVFRENNRTKINQQQKEKRDKTYHCDACDCDIKVGSKYIHNKSKAHLANL